MDMFIYTIFREKFNSLILNYTKDFEIYIYGGIVDENLYYCKSK